MCFDFMLGLLPEAMLMVTKHQRHVIVTMLCIGCGFCVLFTRGVFREGGALGA